MRAIVCVARDGIANALAVMETLERSAGALRTLAARGRIVPELRRVGERRFRELIESPSRIIYRIEARSVHIVAVVDSRRDLQDWMKARAVRFVMSRT